jgi:tetratricopeptide (TPR) repeat protein
MWRPAGLCQRHQSGQKYFQNRNTNLFLGVYYRRAWLYQESLEYYANAISIARKSNLKHSLPGRLYSIAANSLGNLGTIHRDLGHTEKSLQFYKKGIQSAMKDNDLYELWWIRRDMSELYLKSGDTSGASWRQIILQGS